MNKVNIVLMGKTGVGKSTIINRVFGENTVKTGSGRPVTQEIELVERHDCPLRIYDTRGIELSERDQDKAIEDIKILLKEKAQTGDSEEFIHYIWYCINSRSNRIEEYELDIIKKLSNYSEVIIVLTQSIGENWKTLYEEIEKRELPAMDIIPILAKDYEINESLKIDSFGVNELIDISVESIDKAILKAEAYSKLERIDKKAVEAKKIIRKHIGIAFGTGLVPIPLQDAFLLVPNQVIMINKINKKLGLEIDRESTKVLVMGVAGTIGATAIGRSFVTSAMKFVPGLGSIAGGMISASTAAFLTTALGLAYIETATTFMRSRYLGKDIDFNEFKFMFKEKYSEYIKKGKNAVKKEMDK